MTFFSFKMTPPDLAIIFFFLRKALYHLYNQIEEEKIFFFYYFTVITATLPERFHTIISVNSLTFRF